MEFQGLDIPSYLTNSFKLPQGIMVPLHICMHGPGAHSTLVFPAILALAFSLRPDSTPTRIVYFHVSTSL